KSLLRHLGSVRAVREASDEALLAVPGVSRRHLAALRAGLLAPAPDPAAVDPAAEEVADDLADLAAVPIEVDPTPDAPPVASTGDGDDGGADAAARSPGLDPPA